jgi:hypothetical protein
VKQVVKVRKNGCFSGEISECILKFITIPLTIVLYGTIIQGREIKNERKIQNEK